MKTLIWVIVVILIVLGAWLLLRRTPTVSPATYQTNTSTTTANASSSTTNVSSSTGSTTASTTLSTITVTYTDSGFSPKTVDIKRGQAVKFVNESSKGMWVAVNQHPTHTLYDGTSLQQHCASGATPSFDSCRAYAKGSSYLFVFDKAGTWPYHNHASIRDVGTVVVK